MKYYIKLVILLLLILTSCNTQKKAVTAGHLEKISTKNLINNHYHHHFKHQTIDAKINAKYSDQNTTTTVNIKLRLEKDKTIWMSATKFGIPLAKVKITPTYFSYYEKLNKTYFEGDFVLLSKWLGAELDYDKVQNILLGQAVLDLKKGRYNSKVIKNTYELSPKRNNELFGILFFMNPENFKMDRQEIRNPKKQQLLSVSYQNYKNISGEQFPENINIRAIDSLKLTTINLEYKSVEFNKELTFPFSIPGDYKEIKLK